MSKRAPQNLAKIPLRPVGKLTVKDKVTRVQKNKLAGICLFEMQHVFLCFKNYNFNEKACASEIKLFKDCYNKHLQAVKEPQSKTNKNIAPEVINKLLKQYPERKCKIK